MIDGVHAWRLNVVLFSSLSFYALLCFTVSCLRFHACVLFLSFFPVVFGFFSFSLAVPPFLSFLSNRMPLNLLLISFALSSICIFLSVSR